MSRTVRNRTLGIAQVTKPVAFVFTDNKKVFDQRLIVFSLDKYCYFAIMQSSIHYYWAWKNCSTLESRLSYTPTTIFETFSFPQSICVETEAILDRIGETYHEHRRQLMLSLQIGLTKAYNLFHKKDLAVVNIEKESKQPMAICEKGYQDILKLRELHVEMDNAVLAAYDWTDINLAHNFYEVDYLPENDRIRFTISPNARREVLKRLLKLNHEIRAQEEKAGLWDKKKTKKKEKPVISMVAEPTLPYGTDPVNELS